jgi:hypothetical protein
MTPENILQRCHDLVGTVPEDVDQSSGDSLIGFFQSFRPDGTALQGLFDGLSVAVDLQNRLDKLFTAAGDDRRPEGGRDAYFVIRKPEPLDPTLASELAIQWLAGIRQLADTLGEPGIGMCCNLHQRCGCLRVSPLNTRKTIPKNRIF